MAPLLVALTPPLLTPALLIPALATPIGTITGSPDLCTAVITLVIYLCLPLGPPCAEPQIHPIIPELAVDV
jgi:hypothetical protein